MTFSKFSSRVNEAEYQPSQLVSFVVDALRFSSHRIKHINLKFHVDNQVLYSKEFRTDTQVNRKKNPKKKSMYTLYIRKNYYPHQNIYFEL